MNDFARLSPEFCSRSFAYSPVRHPRCLSPSLLSSLFSYSSHGFSRSPLLLSSALDGRRVAILALGLFVRPTTELAPSLPCILATPLCGQYLPLALSRSLVFHRFSLCLSVSVLIRHFVDSMHRAYVRRCIRVHATLT